MAFLTSRQCVLQGEHSVFLRWRGSYPEWAVELIVNGISLGFIERAIAAQLAPNDPDVKEWLKLS